MDGLSLFLLTGLFVLLALGLPFAFTLGILAAVGLWLSEINLMLLAQRMLGGASISSLLAVPGFILAGELMTAGGLSKRLVNFASALMGRIFGGLSMSAVLAGTFFGAISGSAPATTAAIGSVMTDELEKKGYERGYAAALATAIGPLGQMIPPSIPMIIWGVLAEESIARLFLAGVIPGLICALGFVAVSYLYARIKKVPLGEPVSGRALRSATRDGLWALMAPVIILGGIYGGVFTPTEASMIGVLYSLIIGAFVYRELSFSALPSIIMRAMRTTTLVVFIIATAYGFSWLAASQGLAAQVSTALLAITDDPILVILFLCALLLLLGAVMDTVSAMIILSGFLIAIGADIGMDPIQLGVMVVVIFSVGMVTPPVGYSLFVGASVSGLSIGKVASHLWPFLLVLVAVVLLVAYVPAISLWLPGLWG